MAGPVGRDPPTHYSRLPYTYAIPGSRAARRPANGWLSATMVVCRRGPLRFCAWVSCPLLALPVASWLGARPALRAVGPRRAKQRGSPPDRSGGDPLRPFLWGSDCHVGLGHPKRLVSQRRSRPRATITLGRDTMPVMSRIVDERDAADRLADYERRNRLLIPVVRHVLSHLTDWSTTARRRVDWPGSANCL
jgi:hypothetical protein